MPRIEVIVPMRIPGTNILVFDTEVCVVKKAGGDETKLIETKSLVCLI